MVQPLYTSLLGNTAAGNLQQLQAAQPQFNLQSGPTKIQAAEGKLEEAQREQFTGNFLQRLFDSSLVSERKFDKALATQNAAQELAQHEAFEGGVELAKRGDIQLSQGETAWMKAKAVEMAAAGLSPQEIGTQLQSIQAQRLNQIAAQQQAEADLEAEASGRNAARAPFLGQQRVIDTLTDIETLVTQGDVRLPGAAKGAYRVQRGIIINGLRLMNEAGAMQKEELEYFERQLPEYEDWLKLSEAQQLAQLNELRYQFNSRMDDEISASEHGFTRDDFPSKARSYEEIVRPGAPPGTVDGLPETDEPSLTSVRPGGLLEDLNVLEHRKPLDLNDPIDRRTDEGQR